MYNAFEHLLFQEGSKNQAIVCLFHGYELISSFSCHGCHANLTLV